MNCELKGVVTLISSQEVEKSEKVSEQKKVLAGLTR